jgi:hypothetical protein
MNGLSIHPLSTRTYSATGGARGAKDPFHPPHSPTPFSRRRPKPPSRRGGG